MRTKDGISRRHFLATCITLATTHQLQRTASALGMWKELDICHLTAEQEQGPYYLDKKLIRSSLAEGKAGIPLSLRLLLLDARSCRPVQNAIVDVWHCDALGLYSGFTKQAPWVQGGPPAHVGPPPDVDHYDDLGGGPERFGPAPNHPLDKLTFLRGTQITAQDGSVTYATIFPGFYLGRTNHIHFKVRLSDTQSMAGVHTSHIGQIFFPEDAVAKLMENPPYSLHAIRRTTQAKDEVFQSQQGILSVATLRKAESKGFYAQIVAAINPSAESDLAQPRIFPT